MMIPGKLVTVRRYAYRELATTDHQLLADEGIEAYLKGHAGLNQVTLMVAEEQAARALELLSATPQMVSEHEESLRCPYCHSADAESRPSYALATLAIGFVCAAIATVYGSYALAVATGVLTAVISTMIQWKVPRWRCRSCGYEFGTMSARGVVKNFPNRMR